ncbi:hypothetical protein BaRGS_00011997, partial [Batillaria attramentaria]
TILYDVIQHKAHPPLSPLNTSPPTPLPYYRHLFLCLREPTQRYGYGGCSEIPTRHLQTQGDWIELASLHPHFSQGLILPGEPNACQQGKRSDVRGLLRWMGRCRTLFAPRDIRVVPPHP